MSSLNALIDESVRLLKEKGWTQDVMARDPLGNAVDPLNPDAACFCLVGDTDRASWNLNRKYDAAERHRALQ